MDMSNNGAGGSERRLQYADHVEDWSDQELEKVLRQKESKLERLEFECEKLRERLENRGAGK